LGWSELLHIELTSEDLKSLLPI